MFSVSSHRYDCRMLRSLTKKAIVAAIVLMVCFLAVAAVGALLVLLATPVLAVGTLVACGLIFRAARRRTKGLRNRRLRAASRVEGWQRLYSRRDDLLVRWSRYETDVALMIDYPVMTDYSDPVIREVVRAMQGIRTAESMETGRGRAEDSALGRAVDRFEVAFLTAEKYARRCGQSKLTDQERRRLSTARQALNIILDGAAAPSEVQAAYRSLRSNLSGIIDLPERAVAELKSHSGARLTAAGATAYRPAERHAGVA